jgi:hypothetical protein
MDNFNLNKYLVENKVTTNSKMLGEALETTKKLRAAAVKSIYGMNLDDPNDFKQAKEDGYGSSIDVLEWMLDSDAPGVKMIPEDKLDLGPAKSSGGTGGLPYGHEIETELRIYRMADKSQGFEYVATTDVESFGGNAVLLDGKTLSTLKDVAALNTEENWEFEDRIVDAGEARLA